MTNACDNITIADLLNFFAEVENFDKFDFVVTRMSVLKTIQNWKEIKQI